ncbi:MAG TPA: pyridoxine 5'-phosphate synthase [Nitrospinaceae bacterium]|jgi:pyridoxine 5-phosphate synthase|nr:pyridoxine 5'-phosphate synthase [Nitrospinaceae bacterium]HIB43353.1 pyridoxine 5'-phosphate synthase [Nitrospina sp.]HIN88881.1 pyridoxine 5'-phosphate synthase [Nitrospinaceae bacterium]|tara:strand:+ start:1007 stop:1726 length:720 start_codon:yes stop_codon:yes gene_type:complete
MIKLFVNVDHVATVREARKTYEPDPLKAALLAEKAGAYGITAHLREDRRHVQDDDIRRLKDQITTPLNLEMAAVDEMIRIAIDTKPFQVSIVPEKRQEITTEGGVNILEQEDHLIYVGHKMKEKDILFSLFIDPDSDQVEAAKKVRADSIELNTGPYSEASSTDEKSQHLVQLGKAAMQAHDLGLRVFAGHGLTTDNVPAIIHNVPWIEELNIGHHIVSRSIYVGMEQSVKDMINCIQA